MDFFINSQLLKAADLLDDARELRFNDGKLSFFNAGVNAYFASVAADFIRHKLIECSKSFTFETVMSFPDKVEFLRRHSQEAIEPIYIMWQLKILLLIFRVSATE